MNWLIAINAIFAIATVVFGIFSLVAPHKLAGQPQTSDYFSKMYAVRAIPFGIGLAVVLVYLPEQAAIWLVVAGFMQLGDAWANLKRGVVMAFLSPLALALLHFVSAWLLLP